MLNFEQMDALVHGAAEPQEYPQKESMLDSTLQRFQTTVECAPIGIAHVLPDGSWLWVNDQLCAILGYSREELLVGSFQDITYPQDLAADLAYVERMLGGDITQYALDKRYIRGDGSTIWARLTVSLVRDDKEKPQYFISVIEDISERKRLEEALQRAVEEQIHALSIVGHEVGTPLTALKARTQLLRRGMSRQTSSEKIESHLAAIERAATQLERQVLDLRMAARMQQETLTLQHSRCNLVTLCQHAIEEQRLITRRQIRSDLAVRSAFVKGDSGRISQVITNLLTNALTYSPAERPVTVSLRRTAREVIVAVQDEGPGIPADALPRIFDRFYRVSGVQIQNEIRGSGGLGLGLYIARTLVEQQGGRLEVESVVGVGATFRMTLPLMTD